MIIPGAKKKLASAILSFNGEGPEEEEKKSSHRDEDASEMGSHHAVAQEVIEAINERNPIELAAALKAFFYLCEEEEDEGEQE